MVKRVIPMDYSGDHEANSINPSPCSRQGLPFCDVTGANCRLLPYSFHPYPFYRSIRGGIVSVALSLGFPPVAVSNCLSLCCPDFPLAKVQAISRLSGLIAIITLMAKNK